MAYYPTNVGNGHKVNVEYGTEGVVRILNDAQLKNALRDPNVGAVQIAKFVKSEYVYQRRQTLDISDLSLAYEIMGHVYPQPLLIALQHVPNIPTNVKDFLSKQSDRLVVIDAGDNKKHGDSNRWVWDTIATVTKTMIRVIMN